MTHKYVVAAAMFSVLFGGPAASAAEVSVVQSDALVHGTGGEAYPWFEPASGVPVSAGEDFVLPTNGGEAIVQTAASLPDGFSEGMTAFAQARSVAQYVASREARLRVAARAATASPRG